MTKKIKKNSKKVKIPKNTIKCNLKVPAEPKEFRQYFFGIIETEKSEKKNKIDNSELNEREKTSLKRDIDSIYESRKSDVELLALGDKKEIPKWMRKYYSKSVKLPIVKFEEKSKLSKNKTLVSYIKDPAKRKIGSTFMEIVFADTEDLLDFASDVKLVDKEPLEELTIEELIKFIVSDTKTIKKKQVERIPAKKSNPKEIRYEKIIVDSEDGSDVEIPLKKKSKKK